MQTVTCIFIIFNLCIKIKEWKIYYLIWKKKFLLIIFKIKLHSVKGGVNETLYDNKTLIFSLIYFIPIIIKRLTF